MKYETFNKIELALYYIVIFFILREWLLPVMMLTGVGYVNLFLFFIVICLFISLFRIPFYLSWLVKILYISWFTIHVYSDAPFISPEGIGFLWRELLSNFALIAHGEFFYTTNPFQTMLFFLLMWMLVYIVHYWLTIRMNIFYFLVLTVIFIGVLDTFTEYDGTVAIVEVVLLGLAMLVFLYIKKLIVQYGASFRWQHYLKIALPAILLIGMAGLMAIFLPKADPQWPDPVPYIKSAAGQGSLFGEKVNKVGYDEDDSVLGGSFVGDDTTVFIAQTTKKQYWRVETKDIYTSKGWVSSDANVTAEIAPGQTVYHSLPVGPDEQKEFAHIELRYPYDFIIQPYGLMAIHLSEGMENKINLTMNVETEKISANYTGNYMYHIEYSTPEYLYSDLMSTMEQPLDAGLRRKYLQLPESLPRRVIDLAEEIVKGKESDYEKARAIESYFGKNGFRYETKGVPVPEENQDYVDQFLFETKFGYCDNFSTAMVVMLRAVGIPARWVKGFAGGDLIDREGELDTYKITNNHAHSWVEAYIPEAGWVPFEPTIGFSANRSIQFDIETDESQEDMLIADENTEPENKKNGTKEETARENNEKLASFQNLFKYLRYVLYLLFSGIAVAGILLVVFRKRWMLKWYSRWLKNQNINETTFEAVYMRLLKMLELKGFKRKKGQTLGAFAKEVDEIFHFPYMSQITEAYENYIYGNKTGIDYEKLKECWENLINRTSS
ncbi:transglutaminase domain-containing protein [Ureibacillus sp. FSL K6-8385]|uniref:transglutaminase TgpA family protein n=1 Tax=Ureibacillus sp. FSL K6-8385 TaxID=2954684 RepID=UPI003158142E